METYALALFTFFIVGYFLLGGLDIGVGMLLPVLGRNPPARRLVIATIAPFFLANEVWLVASAGLLSGTLPGMEAGVFGRLRTVLIVLVLGWIVRDMGLWLRGRADSRRWWATCDAAIVVGSWTIAVCWGLAVGVLLGGSGPLFAVTACAMFALYGAVFAALRLPRGARDRALSTARTLVRVAVLAGVPAAVGAIVETGKIEFTAGVVGVLAVALIAAWVALGRGREGPALVATAIAMAAPAALAGAGLPAMEFADGPALTLVAVVVTPLLPVLLGAQAWVWWMFRQRVDRPSYL